MSSRSTTPRSHELLEEIQLAGGRARIPFLARRLNVSEETIRRTIRSLEEQGRVTKVHGGVHLREGETEKPLHARMGEQAEAKRLIAARLARMITDGDSLFLDIGSTTAFIAQALTRHRDLLVVTNSLAVAQTLCGRNGNRIFLAGGELRAHDGGAFGQEAISFIRRFRVTHAVLSVTAVHAEDGFLLADMEEAELSREAARIADRRIIVADSHKFGLQAPIIAGPPEQYAALVTERAPPQGIMAMLERHQIELILA